MVSTEEIRGLNPFECNLSVIKLNEFIDNLLRESRLLSSKSLVYAFMSSLFRLLDGTLKHWVQSMLLLIALMMNSTSTLRQRVGKFSFMTHLIRININTILKTLLRHFYSCIVSECLHFCNICDTDENKSLLFFS